MDFLLSKILILLLCMAFNLNQAIDISLITSLFLSLLISTLFYFNHRSTLKKPRKKGARIELFLSLTFFMLCFIFPHIIMFTPFLIYDIYKGKNSYYILLFLIPVLYQNNSLVADFRLIVLGVLALVLKIKDIKLEEAMSRYFLNLEASREQNIVLHMEKQALLAREKENIEIAILKERNRIAKNIHDDVGHLITRALLQIGALSLITTDTDLKKQLEAIKVNLDFSMNQIRHSVHDIHKTSIDLKKEIDKLTAEFSFCPIRFEWNIGSELPLNITYALISIVKECLTNTMKHSNATQIKISFNELFDKYTFLIIDNGVDISQKTKYGMGLYSMMERVKAFQGTLNISEVNGYRVFITIDKEKILDETSCDR